MKLCLRLFAVLVVLSAYGAGQSSQSVEQLEAEARSEYSAGKFADAERDFRALTIRQPANIYGFVWLGNSLFQQQKYSKAVAPYEKARALESSGAKLSSDQDRILTDQLATAYGISGELSKSRVLLEDAIRKDPDYPLNYYNLACVFAEGNDKTAVLTNLSRAFQHKGHLIKGEQMPDPRADSSFQKYAEDADFRKLMKEIGYN